MREKVPSVGMRDCRRSLKEVCNETSIGSLRRWNSLVFVFMENLERPAGNVTNRFGYEMCLDVHIAKRFRDRNILGMVLL